MIEYYEQLETEEKQDITTSIQLLLKQTFLLERKYDKRVGRMQFNKSYRICYKHFSFLKEYLAIAGIELMENSQSGVIYIRGEQVLGERLSKLSTIYLLVLKIIYDEQMAAASNSEQIYTSLSDMNERIGNYGLLKNRPTLTEIRKSISVLRRYQILDSFDSMDDLQADSRLVIYPSINLVLYGEDARAYLLDLGEETERNLEEADLVGEDEMDVILDEESEEVNEDGNTEI